MPHRVFTIKLHKFCSVIFKFLRCRKDTQTHTRTDATKTLPVSQAFINYYFLSISLCYVCFCADVAGWPDASCRFPDWLTAVTWRDLDGQSRYGVDDESMTFFVHSSTSSRHHHHHHHHQSDDRSELRCLQKTSETDHEIVVYAFAMHNWLVMGKRFRFFALK